jgi:hypothetical protein
METEIIFDVKARSLAGWSDEPGDRPNTKKWRASSMLCRDDAIVNIQNDA